MGFSRSYIQSHFYLFLNKFYKFTKTTSSCTENSVHCPLSHSFFYNRNPVPFLDFLSPWIVTFSVIKFFMIDWLLLDSANLSAECRREAGDLTTSSHQLGGYRGETSSSVAYTVLSTLHPELLLLSPAHPDHGSVPPWWPHWWCPSLSSSHSGLVTNNQTKRLMVTSGPRPERPKVNVKASISPIRLWHGDQCEGGSPSRGWVSSNGRFC